MTQVEKHIHALPNGLLPVSCSVVTAAVKPTPEEPRPVVGMARGAVCKTYLR